MSGDASLNMFGFVFDDGTDDIATGWAPARSEDGLREAWSNAQQDGQRPPGRVTMIQSIWALADGDRAFLAATFPHSPHVDAMFERPDEAGWPAALERAQRVLDEAAAQPEQPGTPAGDDALLPVVRSTALDQGFLPMLARRPFAGGALCLTFARVRTKPNGRIGMQHVMERELSEGGRTFDELADEAFTNLSRDLRFGVAEDPVKGKIAQFERPGSFAGSALAMPNFHATMTAHLGPGRLIVGAPCPDQLYVTRADSGWADEMREMVFSIDYDSELALPSVLASEPAGLTLLAQRTTGLPGSYDGIPETPPAADGRTLAFHHRDGRVWSTEPDTGSDDALRQFWKTLVRKHNASPGQIVRVIRPAVLSEADEAFLTRYFANAEVISPAGAEPTAPEPGAPEPTGARFVPVVFSPALDPVGDGPFRELTPSVAVTVMVESPAPEGGVALEPLPAGDPRFAPLLAETVATFGATVEPVLSVRDDHAGWGAIAVLRADGLASSALALSDLLERISAVLGTDDVVLGLFHEHVLWAVPADVDWLDDFMAAGREYAPGSTLVRPTLLRLDRHGLRDHLADQVLDDVTAEMPAERPEPAEPVRPDLVAVLRSVSVGGTTLDTLPSRAVVPGVLAITLAQVTGSPPGVSPVFHATAEQWGRGVDELVGEALDNLGRTLQLAVTDHGADGRMVEFVRTGGSGAGSAIALPDLAPQVAALLDTDEVLFGLGCADHLYAAPAAAGTAGLVRWQIEHHDCADELVRPALIRGARGEPLTLVAEFDPPATGP